MRILSINISDGGSTGTIMNNISESVRISGGTAYTFSRGWKNQKKQSDYKKYIGTYFTNGIHVFFGKKLNLNGCFSISGTLKLVEFIKKNDIDLIHIHNIHAYCVNLPILFLFLKKRKTPIVWTFHDCWPMTGYCTYFTMINCEKWKVQCSACPQLYGKGFCDTSKLMHCLKKSLFSKLENLYIVTPSKWLAKIVDESYLMNKKSVVINNGINLDIFRPHNTKLREKLNCINKKIVLGVAYDWDKRKGIDIFIKLASELQSDYQIIMIGTSESVNQMLPSNIISIYRTENQHELADYYSIADVFINPTREDNFPTTNIEALACGAPVITFNTGGSPEIIDSTCGICVEENNFNELLEAIRKVCTQNVIDRKDCILRAQKFSKENMCSQYLRLYEEILK